MKAKERERLEAIEKLREILKPGDTVYTILRHVSQSGMLRAIDTAIFKDNEPWNIGYLVAKATGSKLHPKYDGISVGGCGQDMGFHLVYSLSYALFPDGFDCIGEHCPSNDHSNRDERHHHPSGGYALKQRWL